MLKHIKRILSCVRQYKVYAIITPILMIGEVSMEVCMPFVMSIIVDNFETIEQGISANKQFDLIWKWVIILLGMAVVSLLCGMFAARFASIASNGLGKNLRNELFNKIQSFSFKNIDKFSESSLITRMTTDINSAQMAFQMMIRIVVRSPLMFVFSIIMAFMLGGQMAWIFLILIPIIGLSLFLIIFKALPIFRNVFKKYDKLNQSIQENVRGIRVVKSYVREDYEEEKFNKASDEIAKELIRAEKIVSFNNPVMMLGINVGNLLVCTIGSYIICSTSTKVGEEIAWGALSVGNLSALLTYGVQILMSLMMLSGIFVMLTMSFEAIRRIGEVLSEVSDIQNPENPIMEVEDGSIRFNDVNFKYSSKAERYALSNVNINIKPGEFIGIIGSTGSGKTTLINLISRLYDVSDGEVLVGNKNVKEYDLKTLRDNVSVVLQKNLLFSGTIRTNLLWGDETASDEEILKACDIAQAREFVDALGGLDYKIDQGGANVSGGQKQRLCIARAILKKPKILILDDSTSAVDTKTDALIRKGLREEIPETTKIVIAQRISSIEDANQIIVMEDGKINAVGTHELLLKENPIYQEIYYTQTKKGGKN
jgi:ATP-binding cassette subfamily B protein